MKKTFGCLLFLFQLFAIGNTSHAQVKWIVGGNMGLAIASGGGASSTDFTFGPMAEVLFGKGLAVGTEFDITTASNVAITWPVYFKYYFSVPGSNIKPYAAAGLGLVFQTGGPYFFIPFGGGANFGVAKNLYVSADLTLGPTFVGSPFPGAPSTTLFNIVIRPGIRYEIP
jgi:hypothetical protein